VKAQANAVPLDLEVITGGPPKLIPIYDRDADFWKLYPDMKASSLARFLETAQSGTPGPIDQLIPTQGGTQPSDDQLTALKQQQLDHFEESLRFVRSVLGGSAPLVLDSLTL
jgi:hypothetical protein